jgi:hypothetical protein
MSWSEQNTSSSTFLEQVATSHIDKWNNAIEWAPRRFYGYMDRTWGSYTATQSNISEQWRNYTDNTPSGYLFKSSYSEQNPTSASFSETETGTVTWSEL